MKNKTALKSERIQQFTAIFCNPYNIQIAICVWGGEGEAIWLMTSNI